MSEEQKTNAPLIGEIYVEGEAPPQYYQTFLKAQEKAEDAAERAENAATKIEVDQQYIEAQVTSAEQAAEIASAAARDAARDAAEVDAALKSKPQDGYSPQVRVSEMDFGYRVEIDYRDEEQDGALVTARFDVKDGKDAPQEAILFTPQPDLSEEEKAQARENIGAASQAELFGQMVTFPLESGYIDKSGNSVSSSIYKHTEKISATTLYTFEEAAFHSIVTWRNGICQGMIYSHASPEVLDSVVFDEIVYNFQYYGGNSVTYGERGLLGELDNKADVDDVYLKNEIDTKFGTPLALSGGYYSAEGTVVSHTTYKHTERLKADSLHPFEDVIPHSVVTWLNGVCQGMKVWSAIGSLGEFDEVAYNFFGYAGDSVLIIEDTYLSEQIKLLQEQTATSVNYLKGKKIAVMGDSISTNGAEGVDKNAFEIEIQSEDVGVQLSAYLTYYDVYNFDGTLSNLTIGGHTFTADEIGTEVTFTPTADDVGKCVGKPNTYYGNTTKVWWEHIRDTFGCTMIPVCWSGSCVTSHEADQPLRKTAHSWHDAQIRKCGIRRAGTMERTAPDIIIIYRGTNDFSKNPYAVLTDGYFDSVAWEYPTTDLRSDGKYGYKEGLCLTIKKLREAYPNAQIFLCTLNVFKRINYDHYPTNNGINTLPQYNNAIREVADYMGCGLIEFDKDGITFENCYNEGYVDDSSTEPTHPSEKGHATMGRKAIRDLQNQYTT